MNGTWRLLGLTEKTVALELVHLAILALVKDPRRSLEDCVEEYAAWITSIISENLPSIIAEWSEDDRDICQQSWSEAAMDVIYYVVSAANSMLDWEELQRKIILGSFDVPSDGSGQS